MHICKNSHLIEPDALPVAFGVDGLEAANVVTPLDLLIQKEEAEQSDTLEATAAAISAIRRLLITVFDSGKRHPVDALAQLMLVAYTVDNSLVGGKSLEEMARLFDTSKQTFSKRLLKLNKQLHVRSRNQKSSTAVAAYSKNAKAWHRARKAEKKSAAAIERAKQARRGKGNAPPKESP